MGRRREPRKEIQVPVRIFGTDSSGQVFSAKAVTVNVSQQGIELSGVECRLNLDETIDERRAITNHKLAPSRTKPVQGMGDKFLAVPVAPMTNTVLKCGATRRIFATRLCRAAWRPDPSANWNRIWDQDSSDPLQFRPNPGERCESTT